MFIINCRRVPRSDKFALSFNFNQELIDIIKKLPNDDRKYESSNRTWVLKTYALYRLILNYKGSSTIKFEFGEDRDVFIKLKDVAIKKEKNKQEQFEELVKSKEEWLLFKDEVEKNQDKYLDVLHKNLKIGTKLMPHQMSVVLYIDKVRNLLVSHDMGLGKTISSIAYVEMNDFSKVFVLTPNSLKHNYYGEIEKFTNSKAHIIGWKNNRYSISESKYIITNYDYFNPSSKSKMDDKFKKLNIGLIDTLICDECQILKNSDSNTYKNYKRIFNEKIFKNNKESKIFLSGTPAPNRAYELYNILHQISPLDFKTQKYFYEYFCGMTYNQDGFGYNTDLDATKFEELYYKIAPYTHRKRKIDVLDLPPKTYQRVMIEMSKEEDKEYNIIENGVFDEINKTYSSVDRLTSLIKLRQFTSKIKAKQIIEIINQLIECGQKVIVVDFFKESLYYLKEHYGNTAVLHTGDEKNVEVRAKMVKDFQDKSSNIKIFLGSIQTCNYGLTLTAGSNMFVLTMPYSAGQYDQVADRIFRIGQENPVTIYPCIIRETIDEDVFKIVESKRKEIVKVIDNLEYQSEIDESVIGEIMSRLKNKYGN